MVELVAKETVREKYKWKNRNFEQIRTAYRLNFVPSKTI